ncbi:MAG: single-stranded-DNA-specific exonuclease RecJ [Ruminococcus sp.]|nr:single-stranded-DNA-specific exonuclease RecJ [Ruminococcus sp.]
MKRWKFRSSDRKIISKLILDCGVTSLTASALAARGYTDAGRVMEKLQCSGLSDPFLLKDMREAADVLNRAVENGEKICVYGDYDCDGITATAILYTYLSEIGADVIYYIPERSEGYGLNNNAIDSINEKGVKLIVTVDNGISAINEAEYIYSLGMRLIVTDHHRQGEELPRAEAVVDAHRNDCFSPFKFACGAVIALKLAAAMDGGDYTMVLEQFGDLAAIATVADIVSMTGENRYIVSYGLEMINHTDRPALLALKEVSGAADKTVTSGTVGFTLAPRINASGRFGSPTTALKLFLSEDYEEALGLARELDRLNRERKETESRIISEIYEIADKDPMLLRRRVIYICGKNWHHGVIGIAASKILEQFGKPCFIASEENGEIRGSARSFGSFSVFSALTYSSEALQKFGGHPGAGGFTVKPGMSEKFGELLEQYALENHKEMPVFTVDADAVITPQELAVKNIQGLDALEPFGCENEEPSFAIQNAEVLGIVPLSGGVHSKLRIKFGNNTADALMFRTPPERIPVKTGEKCSMIVTLGINEYKGSVTPSVYISDIRPADFDQNKYFSAVSAFEAFMRNEPLPKNYYPAMLPSREETVRIYRTIPEEGINSDILYMMLMNKQLNYCKFCVAAEALRQLGIISLSCSDSVIKRLPVKNKADLGSAPILVRLRECISSN